MEVKLRGLDRYEVEAIQYDGTNSDEICQFILEREPYTQIEGACGVLIGKSLPLSVDG